MGKNLDTVALGTPCIVTGFDMDALRKNPEMAAAALRLLEMGLCEGVRVTKVHLAPVSHDPVAVDVNGQLIALRRAEAGAILVQPAVNNNAA